MTRPPQFTPASIGYVGTPTMPRPNTLNAVVFTQA